MMWQNLLKDRVAIVTGAASGMGRAAAVMFAAHGAKVLVADVNDPQGEKTVATIRAADGDALFVHTDVSSDSSVAAAVKATLDRWQTIDVLYNNAAATSLCNDHDRRVHDLPEAVWDKMLDVTLKSVYLCSKHCIPTMLRNGRGSIINMTSCDAILPEAGFDSYTAAKGGVISLTKAMAVNYGRQGIRVNCISPGYVLTEVQMGWYTTKPAMAEAAHAMHLTRELGQPDDIANMATFLASDLARFITGAIIPVDGGYQIYKPSRADELCRDKDGIGGAMRRHAVGPFSASRGAGFQPAGERTHETPRVGNPCHAEQAAEWNSPQWRDLPSLSIDNFHPRSTDHHPTTEAKLGYSDRALHVLFRVRDRYVRSVATRYGDMVCRDSCVELFVEPIPGRGYFNFEFNCGGVLFLYHIVDPARLPDGNFGRFEPVRPEDAAKIVITTTLPRVSPIEITKPIEWRLEATIPLDVMTPYVGDQIHVGPGAAWRANLFKCGSETSKPHWASWADIGDELNFHQPDKFGELRFAGPM